MESSVNTLLQTLKDNLNSDELVGLDKENYPCLYPESKQAKNNKGNRCWECMPCCYWGLFIFFNQRCIDALVKSTRQSLDAIKRRMQAASKHSKESLDADNKSPALFKVSAYSTRRIFLHIVCKRLLSFAPSARLHLLFVLIASNDLFFLCTFTCLLFSFFCFLFFVHFTLSFFLFPLFFYYNWAISRALIGRELWSIWAHDVILAQFLCVFLANAIFREVCICNQMVTSEIIKIWTKHKWHYSLISRVYHFITYLYHGWRITFAIVVLWHVYPGFIDRDLHALKSLEPKFG